MMLLRAAFWVNPHTPDPNDVSTETSPVLLLSGNRAIVIQNWSTIVSLQQAGVPFVTMKTEDFIQVVLRNRLANGAVTTALPPAWEDGVI